MTAGSVGARTLELARSARAGVLLLVSTVAAFLSGVPLVFPSLGPSAYVLATADDPPSGRVVLGGHAVGVAAGAVAYHGLAGGHVVTTAVPPGALATVRLGVAGALAVAATTFGMRALGVSHAPACATTLIVSLGLLTTALQLAGVVASVGALLAADAAIGRLGERPEN
ncbi:HPP family protein [Halorubellus sp. PRR65]|uniref:HPP family protein n=1 Tax=Halorubellus sp. PRR65 TaxID=3098148 RepID=UPI002B25E24B|nr:HPP family protein [Halorubellus sp. PRR65]